VEPARIDNRSLNGWGILSNRWCAIMDGYGGRNLGKTGRRAKTEGTRNWEEGGGREIFLRDILLYALRSSYGYD